MIKYYIPREKRLKITSNGMIGEWNQQKKKKINQHAPWIHYTKPKEKVKNSRRTKKWCRFIIEEETNVLETEIDKKPWRRERQAWRRLPMVFLQLYTKTLFRSDGSKTSSSLLLLYRWIENGRPRAKAEEKPWERAWTDQ